jgi:hypothetical protein
MHRQRRGAVNITSLGLALLVLSRARPCTGQEAAPNPEQRIKEARDTLEQMCRDAWAIKTRSGHDDYVRSVDALAAMITSLPRSVGLRAAREILVDPELRSSLYQYIMVDALEQADLLDERIAQELIRLVRDTDAQWLARGRAVETLLNTSLRNVAPREELEALVEECMQEGPLSVRGEALLFCFRLREPRLIRRLLDVALAENDEALVRRAVRGLQYAQGQGIVPDDLRETVDGLIASRGPKPRQHSAGTEEGDASPRPVSAPCPEDSHSSDPAVAVTPHVADGDMDTIDTGATAGRTAGPAPAFLALGFLGAAAVCAFSAYLLVHCGRR